MKELSIEEKAKAYDDVVSKLGRFMAQGVDPLITRADVQDFFPELAESEDERIRKGLIEAFKKSLIVGGFHKDKVIAWLEKQGERKPAWKPSDEHIHWLKWAINGMTDTEKANEAETVLEDLYEQLKKL